MTKTIDKKLALNLIELISAIQSVCLSSNQHFSDYLFEDISINMDKLRSIVLNDDK